MKFGIAIELQDGVGRQEWDTVLSHLEPSSFSSLWVSDHLQPLNIGDGTRSIEAFTALAYAANRLKTVRLGTLVSPITFRSNGILLRTAESLSQLNGAGFTLGLGLGWNKAEHDRFGLSFPESNQRVLALAAALSFLREELSKQSETASASSFGLLVGGGSDEVLECAARYAGAWNVPGCSDELYRARNSLLQSHCDSYGRDAGEITRSMSITHAIGADPDDVTEVVSSMLDKTPVKYRPHQSMKSPRWLIGTPEEVARQMAAIERLGIDELMLQWRQPPDDRSFDLACAAIDRFYDGN